MRRNKLSLIYVGAGALDSPLEGARFELSRAHVENIMWITQMRLQTKCRRGGTSGAPSPTWLLCCRKIVGLVVFFIQFSSCVRGVTLGIMPLVAYTQNTAMHTHALTQVLYSLFQNLSSYSLSRRACTCPQVSKRFLLIPKSTHFVA